MAYTGATTGYAAGEQTNTSPVDYALETTYNTAPGGTYQRLRITGESLAVQDGTSTPDEINDLPEDAETVLTSRSVSGSVNGVLSYGTFDDFLAGVLGNDFVDVSPVSASGITLILNPNDTGGANGRPSIWSTNSSMVDVPKFSGWPTSGLLKIDDPTLGLSAITPYSIVPLHKGAVLAISSDVFNIFPSGKSTTLSNAANIIPLTSIVNGVLGKTFTIRKKLAGSFQTFTGNMVNQIQIQLQKGQVPTVQIDFVGSDQSIVTTDVSSVVNFATTSPLMDTVGGFMGCSVFGNAPAGCIQSATITLTRNNSGQDTGMGHVGACGIQFGSLKASIDIEYFFKDFAEFTAWQAGKKGPVSVSIKGSDGYGYQFTALNGRIFNPKNPISGKNSTIVTTISITANPLDGGGTFSIGRITPTP